MKTKEKKTKLSLYLQFVLSIIVIISVVFYFLDHRNISYLEFFLGSNLLVMGYNNKHFYRRKNVTILYFVIGIGLLLFSIIQFFGV